MLGNLPGEPDRGPVNWYIHSTALVAILRSRGAQQFQTKTGCQLFQLAYHYVVSEPRYAIDKLFCPT